jgi:threonine dehydratase
VNAPGAAPTLGTIREAAARIAGQVHRTPVLTSRTLDAMSGATLFFKCENFQRVGAFKFRGASNAVLSLSDDEAARGVATHSSGNHAQALALAAQLRGIPAYIVLPRDAPDVKREAVAGYGGCITLCEPTLAAREAAAARIVAETGATLVHPYNDWSVIAGQGTVGLELMEQAPGLDCVVAPVGGGGLLSGVATAVRSLSPETRVYGAEPEMADDAARSLRLGRIVPTENPKTIADGLRTSLGDKTFPMIRERVTEILTVSEQAIVDAMRLVWERMKIVIEPSAAVALAAVLGNKETFAGLRVGIVISGGNVDLRKLPWMP